MNILVSVIVPNYNKAIYIKDCIESVVKQTYRPLEIIVVDDCSTDSSRDILEELMRRYDCLKCIFLDKNSGVSAARNVGIETAQGEYITMLDSDDYYYNDQKISNEIEIIEKHKGEKILAYSKIVYIDQNGARLEALEQDNDKYMEGNILEQILLDINPMAIPRDYCVSKQAVIDCGMYNVKMNFYEDKDLLVRLLINNEAFCTYTEGTAYRQNTNGLSNKPEAMQLRCRWRAGWKNIIIVNNIQYKNRMIIKLLLKRLFIEIKLFVKKFL